MTELEAPQTVREPRSVVGLLVLCLAVVVLGFVLSSVLIKKYEVASGSMRPTVDVGATVFSSPLLRNDTPSRGDIVLFSVPSGWGHEGGNIPMVRETVFLKRVIGLPGEVISCCGEGGVILINGVPLDEPYLNEGWNNMAGVVGDSWEYVVPEGSYFVMGDNRSNSKDSRHHPDSPFIHKSLLLPYPVLIW